MRQPYEWRRDAALQMMRSWGSIAVSDAAIEWDVTRTMARRILDRMADEGWCIKMLRPHGHSPLGIAIYFLPEDQ